MNNRGIFKFSALILILLLVLSVFAGCNDEPVEGTEGQGNEPKPVENEFTVQVDLYYVNEEYLATGDENLDQLICYSTEFTVESDDEDLVKIIMNALEEVPEDAEGCVTALEDKTVIDAYMGDDDVAYVDFSSEGLSGGSAEEELLIYQIVETLNAGVGATGGVQFLVDGEITNSLMGHIDTSEPIVSRFGN